MANKSTRATRKKSSAKGRDLPAQKDPKGGAQKREGPGLNAVTRGGGAVKTGKARLS